MAKVYFTWDDGCTTDLKLFELHRKYNIPGLFFVPNYNREGRPVLTEDQIRDNYSKLIKFGGHTQNHIYLTELDMARAEKEVKINQEYLEAIIGEPIRHFCFPGGMYNSKLMSMVFKYFNTARTVDTVVMNSKGPLIKPSFHIYPRGKKSLIFNSIRNKNWQAMWYFISHLKLGYFDLIFGYVERLIESETECNIIIWGHSWEIDELDLWLEIEKIFTMLSNKYPTAIASYDDIFEEVE